MEYTTPKKTRKNCNGIVTAPRGTSLPSLIRLLYSMMKNDAGSEMVGRSVYVGGDWVREGRFIRHHNYDGLLFRFVSLGGNMVRITSVV